LYRRRVERAAELLTAALGVSIADTVLVAGNQIAARVSDRFCNCKREEALELPGKLAGTSVQSAAPGPMYLAPTTRCFCP
jgi:hypothetical protein